MAQPVNIPWPDIPPNILWEMWDQDWQGTGPNTVWEGLTLDIHQWQDWDDEWSGGDSFINWEINFVNWEGWDTQNWEG